MYTQFETRSTRLERSWEFRLGQEMRLRNYSKRTIKSYLYYNNELLRFANYKTPLEINNQDIRDYLDFLFVNGKSRSTVDLSINAIKFYYNAVLGRKFFKGDMSIKRPKKEKKLPIVLSRSEVSSMIEKTDNIKHKLMIIILYTAGLRVNELVNLKINDIDYRRQLIMVAAGKGNKDRVTVLANEVIKILDLYLLEYKPLKYIFETYSAGKKITVRTVQIAIQRAAAKAVISKRVSAHTLRHSFATHHLENNVNIRYIQAMLGHSRLETTQIYTQVSTNGLKQIEDLL